MSGLYRKLPVALHNEMDAAGFPPVAPGPRALLTYLCWHPHTGQLPGLSHTGRMALAEALRWNLEDFDKAFAEVSQSGFAKADWDARLVWVPRVLDVAAPANPNVARSWRSALEELPRCELRDEAEAAYRALMKRKGLEWLAMFEGSKTPRKPSPKPSPKPFDQHEEKEKKEEEKGIPPTSSSPKKKRAKTDDGFEAWWAIYPRKEAKGAALKRWTTLAVEDRVAAAGAVQEYADARRGQDPAYTPHPATWLSNQRWNDDRSTWRKSATGARPMPVPRGSGPTPKVPLTLITPEEMAE